MLKVEDHIHPTKASRCRQSPFDVHSNQQIISVFFECSLRDNDFNALFMLSTRISDATRAGRSAACLQGGGAIARRCGQRRCCTWVRRGWVWWGTLAAQPRSKTVCVIGVRRRWGVEAQGLASAGAGSRKGSDGEVGHAWSSDLGGEGGVGRRLFPSTKYPDEFCPAAVYHDRRLGRNGGT